ncbi:amidohydrolase [Microbacterium sp. G2-8]|uniref:amidohydrolase family protein n=1 Tax=Microbacterium sp. G2-8 TaxID=2842454 RepID=UPI001C8918C4|nr:amidohydrolase family protein [Microbacterium sp. G2-8]
MTVLDAHAHVWDPRAIPVDWIAGTALDGPRLPDQLDGADEWIFVEADVRATPQEEVAWVEQLDWPGLVGIVADVALDAEDVRDTIVDLVRRPLVRGARHLLQGLPGEAIDTRAMRRGLAELADAGLAFDACVRWTQLDALTALARAVPDARIVLDHCGKPPVERGIVSGGGRAWREALRRLAELPHVSVKLSGLRSEAETAAAFDAHAPDFLAETLAVFGPDRCLYASDWPVSTGADIDLTTHAWVDIVRAQSGSAWSRVARANAREIYALG